MRAFLRRLRARIKYRHFDRDLAREIDVHRELAERDLAKSGDERGDANARAARLLGNTTLAREDARAVWVARWIEQGLQDLRYALRTMRRELGFAITATVTFSLGLGVLIGVFSVFNAIYFRQWPVRAPGEVFGVSMTPRNPAPGASSFSGRLTSYPVWAAIRPEMKSAVVEAKWAFNTTIRPSQTGPGRAGRIVLVSDSLLDTIGIGLQLGSLAADAGRPVIAITDALWRSAFGADPGVLGRPLWLGNSEVTITGVLERRFQGFPPELADGLMPFAPTSVALTREPDLLTNPRTCCVDIVGRLRPGHTREELAAEFEGHVNPRQASLGLDEINAQVWNTAMASRPGGVRSTVPALFALLFAGCGIVTLLACANIGNLQLARGLRRSKEVAVRLSLGASRGRVVRQLLTESAVIALVGTGGGLVIAWTVPPAILTIDNPSSTVVTPDFTVIAFAVVIAVLATLLSGLAPALRVTRIDWRRATGSVTPGAGALRGVLLASQIALSFGLIASASLLSRGVMHAASGADAGFRFTQIDSMILSGSTDLAGTALSEAFDTRPDIAMTDGAPWSGRVESATLHAASGDIAVVASIFGFNRTADRLLALPLIAGRWPDDDKRRREAVVTRSVSRALWNNEDPLGRTFVKEKEPGLEPYTVVGVMDDVRMANIEPSPTIVLARRSRSFQEALLPSGGDAELRTIASSIDPNVRVVSAPLAAALRKQLKNSIAGASVASGLGLTALLLASLGVFGVFAYLVEERRREIGVRLALGATRHQIRRSIVAATRWPVLAGAGAGLAIAFAGGYVLRANLFGISVLDPLSYLAVALILGTAAVIATFIPLRRALCVDPAVTLRQE